MVFANSRGARYRTIRIRQNLAPPVNVSINYRIIRVLPKFSAYVDLFGNCGNIHDDNDNVASIYGL